MGKLHIWWKEVYKPCSEQTLKTVAWLLCFSSLSCCFLTDCMTFAPRMFSAIHSFLYLCSVSCATGYHTTLMNYISTSTPLFIFIYPQLLFATGGLSKGCIIYFRHWLLCGPLMTFPCRSLYFNAAWWNGAPPLLFQLNFPAGPLQ